MSTHDDAKSHQSDAEEEHTRHLSEHSWREKHSKGKHTSGKTEDGKPLLDLHRNGQDIELNFRLHENANDNEHDYEPSSQQVHTKQLEALDQMVKTMQKLVPPKKGWHLKLLKTPKESTDTIATIARNKSKIPMDKLIFLGFLAGIYISFGGLFSLAVSQGLPHMDPSISKLLGALAFPIALILIVFSGGELFTGNCMYMMTGFLYGKVSFVALLYNWFFTYFANFAGCVAGAYLFGYASHLFAADPWLTNVRHIAEAKTSYDFEVVLVRGIAANWLVCLAVFVAITADDVSGKILAILLTVAAFVAPGFEHCIANMFFVDLGLMYDANTTFGAFVAKNLVPSTIGNIIGGGLGVGASIWYVYGWRPDVQDRMQGEVYRPICCLPV